MSKKFIAMTALSLTENLGSQMWHFASMYAVSRRTGHRILFFREHIEAGKGLRLHKHFKDLPMEMVSIDDLSEDERVCCVYPISNDVVVDSGVFLLSPSANYNFTGLFISYKYWYPLRHEVAQMYRFEPADMASAEAVVTKARIGGRKVVAVHVRRDDYINGVFINVTHDYYAAAFAHFEDVKVNYLVFSDDLPWCKAAFSDMRNVYFSDAPSPIVDMCAMSLCDHNIIANSSFGFWGAFLNRNPDKLIICPAKTLKSDRVIPHVNYAWYPDEFIGLDVGNQ